ncbi:MAG TPA: NUDIX domain-containing protein [Nocardioidaceae bacterium]
MRLRESVRALIIDPEDHVLLVRFHWEGFEPAGFWANPGGGIEAGETRLDAIRRELREETGLVVDTLGPEVWTKTALFPMTQWDGQVDHIHLYRTERFEPRPGMTPAQLAAEHVHEIRWWAPDELTDQAATFAPRSLPTLLDRLRREGVPAAPLELEGF